MQTTIEAYSIAFFILFLIGITLSNAVLYAYYRRSRREAGELKTIVPTFKPPAGISPAMCRVLINKQIDEESIVDTLLELDRRGIIKMDFDSSDMIVTFDREELSKGFVWPHEAELLIGFFAQSSELSLRKETYRFGKAIRAMASQLHTDTNPYFRRNVSFPLWLVALGFVTSLIYSLLATNLETTALLTLGLVMVALAGTVVPIVYNRFKYTGGIGKLFFVYMGCQFLPFVCLCCSLALSAQFAVFSNSVSTLLFFGYIIFVGNMFYWHDKYSDLFTESGLMAYREVMGYRLFLDKAMKHRLQEEKEMPKEITKSQVATVYAFAMGIDPGWYASFTKNHKDLFRYINGNFKEYFDSLNSPLSSFKGRKKTDTNT